MMQKRQKSGILATSSTSGQSKAIIFDASTLISFAMNGMLEEFKKLKDIFHGDFFMTKEVKYEVIDRPINTKRFELEALKLKKLLEDGVFVMPEILGISDDDISKETKTLMDIANNTFHSRNKPIHLIDLGETSCLALSKILTKKNIENVIAVDERTIRLLGERPENLKSIFQKKLNAKISTIKDNYKDFKDFKFIRSAELVYIIYKKGLSNIKEKALLDAMLYAMKFKGCSITEEEIKEIKKFG